VTTVRSVTALVLRVVVAAGLVVDAVVHLRLAAGYQLAAPGGIGQGNLFRVEAVVALAAAALVLFVGSRWAFVVAALVGLSALAAVVLTRYVHVPALGPLPAMYEPIWFFEKSLSAVAEGVSGCVAVLAAVVAAGRRGRAPARQPAPTAR
jgi:hypothetical protein